jgi:hypothetical protein
MQWSMNSNVTLTPLRRPHVRLARVLMTVPVAVVLALALTPAQGSTSSRPTILATSSVKSLTPGHGLSSGPTVKLFAPMKLTPGTYYVKMPVTIKHTNPDQADYVDVSLICKDNYGHMNQMGQAVNTLHGTTFTLEPRFYVTLTGTQRGVCVGYAYEGRIHGNPSAAPSTRRLTVVSAQLIVTPVTGKPSATMRFEDNTAANNHPLVGHSSRASKGVHFHAAPVSFKLTPNNNHTLALTANVFLTACTSPGGSRDPSTNGRNLCASVFKIGGSGPLVRTRLMVQQYQANGTTACRTIVVPNTTSTFHIAPLRHHLPVLLQAHLSLPVKAGCGSHLKAWTEVYVESAPSVVVHFPSSVTSVLPI